MYRQYYIFILLILLGGFVAAAPSLQHDPFDITSENNFLLISHTTNLTHGPIVLNYPVNWTLRVAPIQASGNISQIMYQTPAITIQDLLFGQNDSEVLREIIFTTRFTKGYENVWVEVPTTMSFAKIEPALETRVIDGKLQVFLPFVNESQSFSLREADAPQLSATNLRTTNGIGEVAITDQTLFVSVTNLTKTRARATIRLPQGEANRLSGLLDAVSIPNYAQPGAITLLLEDGIIDDDGFVNGEISLNISLPVRLSEKSNKNKSEVDINSTTQITANDADLSFVEQDLNIRKRQHPASINKPVKWSQYVKGKDAFKQILDGATDITFEKYDFETDTYEEISSIDFASDTDQLRINYETPAPQVTHRKNGKSKEIVISSELHYLNLESSALLDEQISSADQIELHWAKDNGFQIMNFTLNDSDSDGLFDTVHWITPHLSTQIFKIVRVDTAGHYDENDSFIRDITDKINMRDEYFAEIPATHYAKVFFTRPLFNGDDITVVAQSVGGSIVVLDTLTGDTVAEFFNLTGERQRFVMTNLTSSIQEFTLVSIDAPVAYDWIVDPQLTVELDPEGDISTTWTCTGDTCGTVNFGTVDEGRAALNLSDYISQKANIASADEHYAGAHGLLANETAIEYVTLWAHVRTGSNAEMNISLYNDTVYVRSTLIAPGTDFSWVSVNWTNPTTIGNLSARYTVTKNGVGAPQFAFAYSWYMEIGYNDTETPRVAFVTNTPANDSFLIQDYITANVTGSDVISGLAQIRLNLFNESGLVSTQTSTTSPFTYNFTSLPDGTYYLNATSTDDVGNVNSTETRVIILDNSNPLISYDSPTESSGVYLSQNYIETNVSVTEDNLDNVSTRLYNNVGTLLDSRYNLSLPAGNIFTSLSDGLYFYNVTAYDLGEFENSTETRNITLDTINPSISFTSPTQATGQTLAISFIETTVLLSDTNFANATVRIFTSSGSLLYQNTTTATGSYNLNHSGLADGVYYFNATTYDLAGNRNDTETRNITLDTTAPTLNVISPLNNVTYINLPLIVNFTASDTNGVDAQWYNNGTANVSYTVPQSLNVDDADYVFTFYANDSTGNFATSQVIFTLNTSAPDSDAPSITINSPLNESYNVNQVLLDFSAFDNVAVDSIWFNDGSGNVTYTVPINKTYTNQHVTIIVYANDTSNNTGISSISFTTDTIDPIISYVAPQYTSGSIVGANHIPVNVTVIDTYFANLTITLYDDSLTVINSTTSTSNPYFVNFTSLSDGTYYYNGSVVDESLNEDILATRNVTLDTQNPLIEFVSPTLASGLKSTTRIISLAVNVTDATLDNITFEIFNSSGDLINSSIKTTSPIGVSLSVGFDGVYYYNVTAYDETGKSNYTETRNITIDTSLPVISFVSPTPAANSRLNQTYIPINISATDNDLVNLSIEFKNSTTTVYVNWTATSPNYQNYTGLTDGIYFIKGIAVDGAGNTKTTLTRAIEIRTVNPDSNFTTYYDPYRDITSGWTCSGASCTASTHYSVLDDGSRQLDTPDTSNFITQLAAAGGTEEHNVSEITEDGITQVTLWAYVSTGSNHDLTINLLNDSTSVQSLTVPGGTGNSWQPLIWASPTSVGEISGRFTSIKNGGGGATSGYVYAWYIQLDYTDAIGPVSAYVSPTETNNTIVGRDYVYVNVTATDSLSGLDNITISLYDSSFSLVSNQSQIASPFFFNFTDLSDDLYYFNVTTYDFSGNPTVLETRQVRVDTVAPEVQFVPVTPANASYTNSTSFTVNVTATAANSPLSSITAYLFNGSFTQLNSTVSLASPLEVTFTSLADGVYYYNVTAVDVVGNINVTQTRLIIADSTAPTLFVYSPVQDSTYNSTSVFLNFTAGDTNGVDAQWYYNGSHNVTYGGAGNVTTVTGSLTYVFYANDSAGNVGSQEVNFTVGGIPQIYEYNATPNSTQYGNNITIYANISAALGIDTVTVTLNGTNYTMNSIGGDRYSYEFNTTTYGVGTDTYYIYANDTSGGEAAPVSDTYQVFDNTIDVSIVDIFVVSSHSEGDLVNVSVNVSNAGLTSANNVVLEFNVTEWTGSWTSNSSRSQTITVGAWRVVNFTYNVTLGVFNFTALIDETDVYTEPVETDNSYSENFSISSYNVYYGSFEAVNRVLTDSNNNEFNNWTIASFQGNIFFADADAAFYPFDLLPLNGTNDFTQADTALGMTNYNDSISALFDSNGDDSADTESIFTVSNVAMSQVPIINSTNTSSFVTGLFWDSTDGGAEYDGSQDLVMVTKINTSQSGQYGVYDYEITVPAPLRSLVGGVDQVTRYDELS